MQQIFTTGVLKLNTRFPRLQGDIGNPDSLFGEVVFETVTDANPSTVITGKPLPDPLVDAFVKAARTLINHPVDLITTSCGFLLPIQSTLTALGKTPVITSSLLLLPLLRSMHGNNIGVLTFDREKLINTLSEISMPEAIEGLQPSDTLRQTIAGDSSTLDRHKALKEVCNCAARLLTQWPATRALVLECTNLSPYKRELRRHTGRPVYDLIDAIHWHQSARDCRTITQAEQRFE